MKKLMTIVLGLMCAVGMAGMAIAGNIDSPGAPGSAISKMPAVGSIYNYLAYGTPIPTPSGTFDEPSSGPASTGRTLTEIADAMRTPFPQCDATAANVLSGKKFFSTVAGSWGVKTGTMSAGGGLLKTGQTSVYQTGDDGTYQKGNAFSYSWDSGTDTVKDNFTGLIWASNGTGAGCHTNDIMWSDAIVWVEELSFAGYTDWRLPNITELQSLFVRKEGQSPLINKTYFPNTFSPAQASIGYWSSTAPRGSLGYMLMACFWNGCVSEQLPNSSKFARAVRGDM